MSDPIPTPTPAPAGPAAAPSGVPPAPPLAPAPEPWYKGYIADDGKVNPSAYERMPDDIKHLGGSLKTHGTIDDVFRKMAHLETLAGKKGLAPLPADAPADAVAARNQLLAEINGVPKTPQEYGIIKPQDLPDVAWNQKSAETAAQIMHKYNVPPAAARELVASQVEFAKQQIQAQADYEKNFFAEQDRAIKNQLAQDGVSFDKANDLAMRAARQFGIDPETNPVFKNASVFLALARAATAIGEPNLVTGDSPIPAGAVSDGAKAEDIIHNKTNPEYNIYWDGGHPQNRAVKAKVAALMESAAKRGAKK